MDRQLVNLVSEGIYDEGDVLRGDSLDRLLDDVVAVLVFDAFQNLALDFLDEERLLVDEDVLKSLDGSVQMKSRRVKFNSSYLLHNTASIHLKGKLGDMPFHLICELLFLLLVAVFEEFLNDIVTKHVRHQLKRVGKDFQKELGFLIAVCGLELLLNEARTVLVAAELHHMVVDVLRKVSQV